MVTLLLWTTSQARSSVASSRWMRPAAFVTNPRVQSLRSLTATSGSATKSIGQSSSSSRSSSSPTVRPFQTSSRKTRCSSLYVRRLLSSVSSIDETTSYDLLNRKRGLDKYEPAAFESEIYQWWEASGCFAPDAKDLERQASPAKKPYVLPMPPPNVTGRLHMGHAIFVALQDVLARFHRMRGRPVLWLPGTDHAGIATQLQVEKLLRAEGTTREAVGRTVFLERVWKYKEEQGGAITNQLRSLGASADWSRERFTMDQDLSNAVVEAFVRLHEKGLVYRGEYMVNWAPMLQTAVSDLEVEYSEELGKLYYFKYMVDGSDEFIPVATTRPETICGDTAVCVHPDDERYQHLIGKNVLVPMSNGRKISVIADEYVDMEFGTGALKITPGHDPNDYELGKKYHLPIINIMNKDGSMNANAGAYEGLDRFVCRDTIWYDMEAKGLTIKVNPHTQRVPRSQRGGEVIEPLVSNQWFVKTAGMGAKALQAVQNGDIKIVPQRFDKIWNNWLTDIRDWCVSRQLWWGHRIPVWYIGSKGEDEYIVARNDDDARQKAIDRGYPPDVELRQEEDVLDTWFSSGLWPFATVGWPQNEGVEGTDLARFYPSTCLETGYDILFFWVARMVMMGLELTGECPFDVVYLHGLVRAADGTKMSKSKGNVIDPLDTVVEFGADSLRYSLVTGNTPGQDIPINMEKIEANRNFANKLWNCCKFVTGNALKDMSDEELRSLAVIGPFPREEFDLLSLPEQYIVSRCHTLVASVTQDIENYQLGAAGSKCSDFLWNEFADWYVEVSKTRLYEGAGGGDKAEAMAARRVLVYILDTSLRLLHPYMPYVTEQLWHHLPRPDRDPNKAAHALMVSDWPQMDDAAPLVTSDKAVSQFECFQALTRRIRNARAEYNVEPGQRISAVVVASGDMLEVFQIEVKSLVALARLDPDQVFIYQTGSIEAELATSQESVQLVVQDGVEAYLPLSGLIDPVKERKRLEKRNEKLTEEIQKLSARLESKGFADKAPPDVVEKVRLELAGLEDQAAKVQSSLASLPQ